MLQIVHAPPQRPITVESFGAIGDGLVDDHDAIQAAINYGSPVRFGNHTYKVTSPLTTSSAPVIMYGDNTILSFTGTSSQDILSLPDNTNCRIEGITFTGGQHALVFSNQNVDHTLWELHNCQFRNQSSYAITTTATGGRYHHLSALLRVKDCLFFDCAQVLDNCCDTAVIEDCWVSVNKTTALPSAPVFQNRANDSTTPGATGTVTVTIASPAVVSWASHSLLADSSFVFSTTGALPTGITVGTTYYVIAAGLTTNTFQFTATLGDPAINTSGSQSGVHTARSTVDFGAPRLILRNMFGVPNVGTYAAVPVTITIASPAVVTWTTHGLTAGCTVVFSTTGALPTGITAGTNYYVIATGLTADTFQFSTSRGGAAVNTSGSQSGVQSANARVQNIRWVDNYTGQVFAHGCRFGGEAAGMPIALQVGAPLTANPFLPATMIVVTDSWIYAGTSTDPSSGVVNLGAGQVPNVVVIRNCNGPASSRYIANPTALDIATYMSNWETASGQSSFQFFYIDIETANGVSGVPLIPPALLPYCKLGTQVDRLTFAANDFLQRDPTNKLWINRTPTQVLAGLMTAVTAWTPVLNFGGASTGITGTLTGSYVKIGALVFCELNISLTSKGSATGAATITGLPFTSRSMNADFHSGYFAVMTALVDGLGGRIVLNGTTMTLQTYSATGIAALTEANFNATSLISFTFFYFTDP